MSKQINTKIVPKLRFPEFIVAGEWEEKLMEEVSPLQRGFDLPSEQIKPGNVPIVYSNGLRNFHNKGMAKGPGIVTGRSGTIGEIHFIEQGEYWPHNTSLWVTSFKGNFPKFVYYLYKSIDIIRFSSGSGVPTLNRNDVHAFKVYIPKSPDEQQKIAACLSSLDDLITAHTQKLDALKAHKKGLMQQLFPAEGETVPRLRFEEFKDSGEWEEKTLEILVDKVGSGTTPLGGDKNYIKSGRPFVRSQNVGWGVFLLDDIVFISESLHRDSAATELMLDDVLLNITGASIGRCAVVNKYVAGGNVNQHVCIIRIKKDKLEPRYLNQYLISEYGQRQIDSFQAGGNRQGLNFAQIRSFLIPIPPNFEEQQKIASCLSSLDQVITIQVERLDQLKTHKKGLMQGLFPVV